MIKVAIECFITSLSGDGLFAIFPPEKSRARKTYSPYLFCKWPAANFTAAEERTPAQHTELLPSDVLVKELQDADSIAIGLPIYNFSTPVALKAWIDQVLRAKVTFHYTDQGPAGLLENKKAYVFIASGGTQVGSDIDFISAHIHHILAFIDISDVTFTDSGGIGQDET